MAPSTPVALLAEIVALAETLGHVAPEALPVARDFLAALGRNDTTAARRAAALAVARANMAATKAATEKSLAEARKRLGV